MTNQTESEISLLLRKHVIKKKGQRLPLPKVLTPGGCLYNQAHFSGKMGHLALDCQSPEQVPRVLLFDLSRPEDVRLMEDFNDNAGKRKELSYLELKIDNNKSQLGH